MNVTHRLHYVALAGLLAACGQTAGPAPIATIEPWPFTVDEVVLACRPAEIPQGVSEQARRTLRNHGARVFVTTSDFRRYAVNGTARSEAPLMTEILARDADPRALIRLGLSLCHGDRLGTLSLARSTQTSGD